MGIEEAAAIIIALISLLFSIRTAREQKYLQKSAFKSEIDSILSEAYELMGGQYIFNPPYPENIDMLKANCKRARSNHLSRALHLDSNYYKTHYYLSICYFRLGDLEKSEEHLAKSEKLDNKKTSTHHLKGIILTEKGQDFYRSAENSFQRSIQLDIYNDLPYKSLGKLYRLMGRFEDEFNIYNQGLSSIPESTLIRSEMIQSYIEKNDFKEAILVCEDAIRRKPDIAYFFYLKGFCHEKLGNLNLAIHAYNHSLKVSNKFMPTYWRFGCLYYAQSDYKNLKEKMIEALTIDMSDPIIHQYLGLAYFGEENYEQALDELRLSFDLDSTLAETANALGMAFFKIGNVKNAEKWFRDALKLKNEYHFPLNNLGDLLEGSERYDKAIILYKQEITKNSNWLVPMYRLAKLYLKLDHVELNGALELVESHQPSSINDPETFILIVKLFINAKRLIVARRWVKNGLERYPENQTLIKLSNQLREN